VPSDPRPGKPRTADPDGGPTCPDRPRHEEGDDRPGRDHRRPGADGGRWVEPRRDEDHRDGRGRDDDRRRRDLEAGDPGEEGRGHDEQERRSDPDHRAGRDVKVTDR
jgi:hypothetical protein